MLATSRVIGHKEWAPGRKSDPRYDMNTRRAQVAAFTAQEDDLDANQAQQLDYVYTVLKGGNPSMDVLSVLYHALLDPLNSASHHGNDDDNPLGHAVSAHKYAKQVVDALAKTAGTASPAVNVDAATVASSLAGNAQFLDALADALAVKLGNRLSNG